MRTTKKLEILLEILSSNENTLFTYDQLASHLKLSYRRTQRILCSLQEKGLVKISKCLLNQRKHLVTVSEDDKMARLRKREITIPVVDRDEMASGLKKTMNKRNRKEVHLAPIRIPFSVLKIINHWNSLDCVPRLKVPEAVDGLYPHPTKLLKKTVSQLRKVLTGNYFNTLPVLQLVQENIPFTVNEVIRSIDKFCLEAYCINHLPYDKTFLANKLSIGHLVIQTK